MMANAFLTSRQLRKAMILGFGFYIYINFYNFWYIYPRYLQIVPQLQKESTDIISLHNSHTIVYEPMSNDVRKIFEKSSWNGGTSLMENLPLRAYIEKPVSYWIPDTKTKSDPFGEPITPIPLRLQTPASLTSISYPKAKRCSDIPKHFPVDRGLDKDKNGKLIFTNVYNKRVITNPMEEAAFCPVDADPFLPWIHDVFPSENGETIHFIAQNKRRCNQGKDFTIEKERLEPQVALMQPISVSSDIKHIPAELWNDNSTFNEKRWRLSTIEDADDDGRYTRFICRFKGRTKDNNVIHIGDTLSVFPINYEFVNKLKGIRHMLTKEGFDKGSFWLSNFQFDCPVPKIKGISEAIQKNYHIFNDSTNVYVDIVPIRTPPRIHGEGVHTEGTSRFDAEKRWGKKHVLPKIEASGRWENIPICSPYTKSTGSSLVKKETGRNTSVESITLDHPKKQNYLVGCLWASLLYDTRGRQNRVYDTEERLLEWLEFHFLAGFDHIYIYDNTGAFTDDGRNLSSVTNLFPSSQVTRIDWPFRVCNNNIPAHENTGERSSQYAAESSCRSRYGPSTEWMASFDTDEYMIPMGKNKDLKMMLKDAKETGSNILSFRSTRAMLNRDYLIPYSSGTDNCKPKDDTVRCLGKNPNTTFLQTYNCDLTYPKPDWADRAKKQIYRPDYVLSHFVHYSTVTKPMTDPSASSMRRYSETSPSERFIDERNEATMLHAKTMGDEATFDWHIKCKKGYSPPDRRDRFKCRVGFPYPRGTIYSENMPKQFTQDNYVQNCFALDAITDYWGPKLEQALSFRREKMP